MLPRNTLYVVIALALSSSLSHTADPGATSFHTAPMMREAAAIQAAERERKAGEERCRQNQARLDAERRAADQRQRDENHRRMQQLWAQQKKK